MGHPHNELNYHLSDTFLRWDATWYFNIASHGYGTSINYAMHQPYAYFPLYPLLTATLHSATGLSIILSGLFISNICFFIALYYFYCLLATRGFLDKQIRFILLLLALSPANIYFTSMYTESLFLALSLAVLYFAFEHKWFRAFLLTGILSATRPNGIAILLPLALILYQDWQTHHKFRLSYFSVVISPLGLLGYMLYLHHHIGDAWAFKHAQAAWGRTGWHTSYFWGEFAYFFSSGRYDPFMILLAVGLFILYKRKLFPEFWYAVVMIAPAFLSGRNYALSRFVLTLFPMYIAYALPLQGKPYLKIAVLFLTVLLLGFYISGWVWSGFLF